MGRYFRGMDGKRIGDQRDESELLLSVVSPVEAGPTRGRTVGEVTSESRRRWKSNPLAKCACSLPSPPECEKNPGEPGLLTSHAQRGGVCGRREVTGRYRTDGVRGAVSRNSDIHVDAYRQAS